MPCIALVTALGIEYQVLRDLLDHPTAERRSGGVRIVDGTFGGQRTVLICTGMGMDRAGHATARMLEQFPVSCAINAGIAGGLQPDARPGDLFLCDVIVREADRGHPGRQVGTDVQLRAKAARAVHERALPARVGRLASVRGVVADRRRKLHLAGALGCDLVDMEACAVAEACQDRGVPLLSLKAICDLADEDTALDFGLDDRGGFVASLRAAARAAAHPVGSAKILLRMKRNVAFALARLQSATCRVLGALVGREEPIAELSYRETSDRAAFVRAMVDRHADRLRGKRVLVKPNMVSLESYPTTTHPETLDALITRLEELGSEVVVGDGPAIDAQPARVMRAHPLCAVCRQHGIEPINFYDTPTVRLQARHHSYRVPALVRECDFFISLPVLKVHVLDHMVLTGALKNQFGLLGMAARLKLHVACGVSVAPIHRCIAELNGVARPDLFIVDAIDVLLNANEQRHGGHQAHLGLMYGGSDPVALDAYGLGLLQRLGERKAEVEHALDIGYLRMAANEYRLGRPELRAVELPLPS